MSKKISDKKLARLLQGIESPARYTGGEYNTPVIKKDVGLNFCLCFPDTYEVGQSNLGIKILYHMLNDMEGVACETAYAPRQDFADRLREEGVKLFSSETRRSLAVFDMVGFSLGYELGFTNILYMLDLAGIPLKASERTDKYPLIVFGGSVCVNPAPLSAFADIICIGDGEEVLASLAKLYSRKKPRKRFLSEASKIEGVYVPTVSKKVKKAVVKDLSTVYFPNAVQVPNVQAVHNRAVLEIYRGCKWGCKFCQAGYIGRPVRHKSVEVLISQAKALIQNCGFDELGLASLSTCDYPHLKELITGLVPLAKERRVRLSLPSTRVDSFMAEYGEQAGIGERSKGSITFAPEAGTQRLRDVIGKRVTDADIERSMTAAFGAGYTGVKLYFMIGLPTETEEDLDGIVKIASLAKYLYKQHKTSSKPLTLNISASIFVPKPHTPFQWEAQDTRETARSKQKYLKEKLQKIGVRYSWHDSGQSTLEVAFARGDERLSDVVLEAYKRGCKFDGWTEYFDFNIWLSAFETCGVNINDYTGAIEKDALLPWDMVDVGINKEQLLKIKDNIC